MSVINCHIITIFTPLNLIHSKHEKVFIFYKSMLQLDPIIFTNRRYYHSILQCGKSFDTVDDPNIFDEDFTPKGKRSGLMKDIRRN